MWHAFKRFCCMHIKGGKGIANNIGSDRNPRHLLLLQR